MQVDGCCPVGSNRETRKAARGQSRWRSRQGRHSPQDREGGLQSGAHSRSQPCMRPQPQHLQDIQIQLCRRLETRLPGPSAEPRGSSSQGDRAHSLPIMMPLALSERFQVGRERHPDHLDTSGLEDRDGLRRKRDLGMSSGTRQGRGGILPDSGLLLLPGMCAQGRPGGFLGGSHSLQGSSGLQGRGGWPGLRLCTSAPGGKAYSPLAAWLRGQLSRC